jgi:hypothetical protein
MLSVHHACMLTVGNYNAVKLIENHAGIAHVKALQQMQIPVRVPAQPQRPSAPVAPSPVPPTPVSTDPRTTQRLWERIKAAVRRLFVRLERVIARFPSCGLLPPAGTAATWRAILGHREKRHFRRDRAKPPSWAGCAPADRPAEAIRAFWRAAPAFGSHPRARTPFLGSAGRLEGAGGSQDFLAPAD